MTSTPSLDIVIVSFNAREPLRACLASLADNPPHRPWSAIVVDNASSDGSADVVPGTLPAATLIRLDENAGFARATNIGTRAGRGDLVLFLNSDTLVSPGTLDRMIEALLAAPEAAALGPRLVDEGGRPELSFGRMLSPWNELRQKLLVGLHERRVPPVEALIARMTSRPRYVDWVSGACLLVHRADAEAVGLLDERYFMYAEDVDFCAALRGRGRRVLFSPVPTIVHARGRSRAAAPEATRAAYRRSHLAFYAKHHPRWYPWLARYLRAKRAWPEPASPGDGAPKAIEPRP